MRRTLVTMGFAAALLVSASLSVSRSEASRLAQTGQSRLVVWETFEREA